jgi:hypothetical protein
MDDPYTKTYTVTKKAKGEHCSLQRAAWKTNKPMDLIIQEITRKGVYEDENWLVVVAF